MTIAVEFLLSSTEATAYVKRNTIFTRLALVPFLLPHLRSSTCQLSCVSYPLLLIAHLNRVTTK